MDAQTLTAWWEAILARERWALRLPYIEFVTYSAATLASDNHELMMSYKFGLRRRILGHIGRRLNAFLSFDHVPHIRTFIDIVIRSSPLGSEICQELYLRYCHALFEDIAILWEYTGEVVEQLLEQLMDGMWYPIHRESLPLELRVAVIESCYYLFAGWHITTEEDRYSCFMFWDVIVGIDWVTNALTDDRRTIRDALFSTLARVIQLDNLECQRAALHGFSHLHDERCHPIIDDFIRECNDPDLVEYARVCRDFRSL